MPNIYGEKKYVVMLGGLHTEMALWNTLGDVLEDSGRTTALVEAEVASTGIAASFVKVAHLTRTRHAHQITLLALKMLQHEAFVQSGCHESKEAWVKAMCTESPTFMYWDFILRQETLILMFVRAHREKNFALYVEVLEKLTPLFFALDPVIIYDRTSHLSCVHISHALEQGMKTIKVCTVDTDVVAILGAYFNLALTEAQVDIWVAFGMGKNFRFYSITAICSCLGEAKSRFPCCDWL